MLAFFCFVKFMVVFLHIILNMRSPIVKKMLAEMDKQPWHIKLRRWLRIRIWLYICLTRKYWDKEYQHYIFKKQKNK